MFAHPKWGGHTAASESSSSRGLPTPRARDWKRGGKDGLEELLLPTPRTSDTNGAGKHGSGGPDLRTVVSLLPTPRATDHKDSMTAPAARRHVEAGNGTLPETLGVVLLPTPRASDGSKGGPNQRGSSGDLTLPSAVVRIGVPTPPPSSGGRP